MKVIGQWFHNQERLTVMCGCGIVWPEVQRAKITCPKCKKVGLLGEMRKAWLKDNGLSDCLCGHQVHSSKCPVPGCGCQEMRT